MSRRGLDLPRPNESPPADGQGRSQRPEGPRMRHLDYSGTEVCETGMRVAALGENMAAWKQLEPVLHWQNVTESEPIGPED